MQICALLRLTRLPQTGSQLLVVFEGFLLMMISPDIVVLISWRLGESPHSDRWGSRPELSTLKAGLDRLCSHGCERHPSATGEELETDGCPQGKLYLLHHVILVHQDIGFTLLLRG